MYIKSGCGEGVVENVQYINRGMIRILSQALLLIPLYRLAQYCSLIN
jgi:hypothetical protein